MTTREELQHLTIEELTEAHLSLTKCLHILNSDKIGLCDLSNTGKEMTLQLSLAQIAIFSRIIELEKSRLNENNL